MKDRPRIRFFDLNGNEIPEPRDYDEGSGTLAPSDVKTTTVKTPYKIKARSLGK